MQLQHYHQLKRGRQFGSGYSLAIQCWYFRKKSLETLTRTIINREEEDIKECSCFCSFTKPREIFCLIYYLFLGVNQIGFGYYLFIDYSIFDANF